MLSWSEQRAQTHLEVRPAEKDHPPDTITIDGPLATSNRDYVFWRLPTICSNQVFEGAASEELSVQIEKGEPRIGFIDQSLRLGENWCDEARAGSAYYIDTYFGALRDGNVDITSGSTFKTQAGDLVSVQLVDGAAEFKINGAVVGRTGKVESKTFHFAVQMWDRDDAVRLTSDQSMNNSLDDIALSPIKRPEDEATHAQHTSQPTNQAPRKTSQKDEPIATKQKEDIPPQTSASSDAKGAEVGGDPQPTIEAKETTATRDETGTDEAAKQDAPADGVESSNADGAAPAAGSDGSAAVETTEAAEAQDGAGGAEEGGTTEEVPAEEPPGEEAAAEELPAEEPLDPEVSAKEPAEEEPNSAEGAGDGGDTQSGAADVAEGTKQVEEAAPEKEGEGDTGAEAAAQDAVDEEVAEEALEEEVADES